MWIGDQYLVAVVQQGLERHIDGFLPAGRDDDLSGGNIGAVVAPALRGNRFPEVLTALPRRVMRRPLIERSLRRLDDMRRRGKIRIAASERDHSLASLNSGQQSLSATGFAAECPFRQAGGDVRSSNGRQVAPPIALLSYFTDRSCGYFSLTYPTRTVALQAPEAPIFPPVLMPDHQMGTSQPAHSAAR